MKIAYIGFDLFFDCLVSLAKSGHEIIKIFTCPVDEPYESNSRVYSFANEHNIPITEKRITETMVYELTGLGCDLIISAGYYYKIPVCSIPAVNIHPALLPIGRGGWPWPCVILKNLDVTGVTIHKIANTFDSGDIIIQRAIAVTKKDNLETLTVKSIDLAVELLNEFLSDAECYLNNAVSQSNGEYWKLPSINDMTFSLNDDYDTIDRITRAFYGYKCYCQEVDKTIEIVRGKCVKAGEVASEEFLLEFSINGGKLLILELA